MSALGFSSTDHSNSRRALGHFFVTLQARTRLLTVAVTVAAASSSKNTTRVLAKSIRNTVDDDLIARGSKSHGRK